MALSSWFLRRRAAAAPPAMRVESWLTPAEQTVEMRRAGHFTICAPYVQFLADHPGAAERVKVFERLGLKVGRRWNGGAMIAFVEGDAGIDLRSVEELMALQREIGLPIRVEDGVLIVEP